MREHNLFEVGAVSSIYAFCSHHSSCQLWFTVLRNEQQQYHISQGMQLRKENRILGGNII